MRRLRECVAAVGFFFEAGGRDNNSRGEFNDRRFITGHEDLEVNIFVKAPSCLSEGAFVVGNALLEQKQSCIQLTANPCLRAAGEFPSLAQ